MNKVYLQRVFLVATLVSSVFSVGCHVNGYTQQITTEVFIEAVTESKEPLDCSKIQYAVTIRDSVEKVPSVQKVDCRDRYECKYWIEPGEKTHEDLGTRTDSPVPAKLTARKGSNGSHMCIAQLKKSWVRGSEPTALLRTESSKNSNGRARDFQIENRDSLEDITATYAGRVAHGEVLDVKTSIEKWRCDEEVFDSEHICDKGAHVQVRVRFSLDSPKKSFDSKQSLALAFIKDQLDFTRSFASETIPFFKVKTNPETTQKNEKSKARRVPVLLEKGNARILR